MITQAIKGWLRKMFAWWPWKQSSSITYSHAVSSLSKGFSQEAAPRSTIDGVAPQAGITPRLSTIEEEWPVHVDQPQPYFPETGEPAERPLLPLPPSAPLPVELPEEKQGADTESVAGAREAARMQPPAPEQQLEFLQYLVRRGIVNEGFEKGDEPEQYRGV
jgi:hypothetical protein